LSAFANHFDHAPATKFALPAAPFGKTPRVAPAHRSLASSTPFAPAARGPPASVTIH
jgi:hypothetical protein